MHVFGVTDNDRLWHSVLPDQQFFGDVAGTGGTGRPWRRDEPESKSVAVDTACAADIDGNLHVLVVSNDGRLWHTRRARDGSWIRFGNVELGGAGDIGFVTAVAATCEGLALRILAVNTKKELHETVWNPETPTSSARFDPRFRKIGIWDPNRGPLHTLAATPAPPVSGGGSAGPVTTTPIVVDVRQFREVHGQQPDAGVARLQLMLNLSGAGSLAENGIYDAATADAVRRFQQANDLVPDGIMTGATWQAFLELWLSGQAIGP